MAKRRNKTRKTTNKRYTRSKTTKRARPSLRLTKTATKPYKVTRQEPLFVYLEPTKTTTRVEYNTPKQQQITKNKYKTLQHGFNNNNLITNQQKICKRRSQRKEIIHAVNKSGQSGQKRPNTNNSTIKC